MPIKTVAVIAVLLGCLVTSFVLGQGTSAPPAQRSESAVGRYQVFATSNHPGSALPTITVIDTRTGQCWVRIASSETWSDLGSPVSK